MTPSLDELRVTELKVPPFYGFNVASFQKLVHIEIVGIAYAVIFIFASSNDVHSVLVDKRRSEFSTLRFERFLGKFNLDPSVVFEIEEPKIIEIVEKLPSEYYHILSDDFSTMVRPLPRTRFVFSIIDLFPSVALKF